MEAHREVQPDHEWLSTEEVAARLSKTDRQVRRDCKEGRLVFRREGRKLLVEATSVAALAQEKVADVPTNDHPDRGTRHEEPDGVQTGAENRTGDDVDDGEGDEPEHLTVERLPPPTPPSPTLPGYDDGAIRRAGALASKQDLDRLFREVRAVAEGHLRTERAFHAKLMEQVNTLERLVEFEHERNREIQAGLREILQQLGGRSVDVDKVTVDVRPRRGWWRGWLGR